MARPSKKDPPNNVFFFPGIQAAKSKILPGSRISLHATSPAPKQIIYIKYVRYFRL